MFKDLVSKTQKVLEQFDGKSVDELKRLRVDLIAVQKGAITDEVKKLAAEAVERIDSMISRVGGAEESIEVKEEEKDEENSFDVTDELVDTVAGEIGYDFEVYDRGQFEKGLEIEQEHADVTHGDPVITARIAFAHIKEIPDYYDRLQKMESDAEQSEAEV